jgi:hypothetical protein
LLVREIHEVIGREFVLDHFDLGHGLIVELDRAHARAERKLAVTAGLVLAELLELAV